MRSILKPSAFRVLAGALALTFLAPGPAAAAKEKRATTRVAPPPATARPDRAARKTPRTGPIARNPGPMLAPGSPIADRYTIAPFPVPGDTSRPAGDRAKLLNAPRTGITATGPLPEGTGVELDERTGGLIGNAPPGTLVMPRPLDGSPEQTLVMPRPLALSPEYPEYPQPARDAGVQGTVQVMAHVLADGTLGETQVVRSVAGLDSAAVASVRKRKLGVATLDGKPVDAWILVRVKFALH